MKVIGFQLVSSGGNRKHYTALVTDTGHLYKHHGARTLRTSPQRGFNLSSGTLDVEILSDSQRADVFSVLQGLYASKVNNQDYDGTFITQTAIELETPPFANQAVGRSITGEFHEKANTAGVLGIASYLGARLRPPTLNMFEEEFEKFSRLLTEDDYVADFSLAAPPPAEVHFTDVEKNITRPNGEVYRPREINGHTDVALLRMFREKSMYVRLSGPPGGGKTALVEAAFGDDLITVNGHGDMTVANFVGTWIPRRHRAAGESEWEWVDGPLSKAMKEGRPFFLDEATRPPTEVVNVLFSVTDGRNILRLDDRPDMEPIHGKKGFYAILGYNPDTLGAKALDEALTSRFKVQIDVYTDFDTARALKVPAEAIKIAQKMDQKDKEDREEGGLGVWVPQMRELLTYKSLIDAQVGVDFALSTLVSSCPREADIPNLIEVIHEVTAKQVTRPTLGGLVM
jgi:hypothetical protein